MTLHGTLLSHASPRPVFLVGGLKAGDTIESRLACTAKQCPLQPIPWSAGAAILSKYAQRGSGLRGKRDPALRALCVAATTSSQTVRVEDFGPVKPPKTVKDELSSNLLDDLAEIQRTFSTGSKPSGVKCNLVLRGLCSTGARWGQVWQLYQDVRNAGIITDHATYRTLLFGAIEARRPADVVDLLTHLEKRHGPPPMPLYCSLVSRLLKQRGRGDPALQAAYHVWRRLLVTGAHLDGPAYRTGMNLCVELGRLDEARRLMDGMRRAGLRPGWGAYHILMKYHCERGEMDAARRLFAELRYYKGSKPLEISAYNTLLSGFVRLGDVTMARAVLDKARREGAAPDAITFSTFGSGLVAAGRLEEAEALVGEAAAAGLPPCPVLYGVLVDEAARRNDWPRAERLLARMRSAGLSPNLTIYNCLIRGRTYAQGAAAGASARGPTVSALLSELRTAGLQPDAVTYGTLMHAAERDGDLKGALGVLDAMRVDGVAPDGAVYTSLMKLFRMQGRSEQALEFFQQLASSRSATVDVTALNCLVAVHAAAGDMAAAEAAAVRAGELAAERGNGPPSEATYALVQGYGRQQQLQPALAAFRRFLAAGGRPHRKLCVFMYRLCLAQWDFTAAGQVLRAMRLMKVDGGQPRDELYRQWWREAQERLQDRRGAASSERPGPGASPAEKWKWWLGLPNRYYDSNWR